MYCLQLLYEITKVMKWLIMLTSLASWLQDGHSVRFSANFDSGSTGDVVLIDSV